MKEITALFSGGSTRADRVHLAVSSGYEARSSPGTEEGSTGAEGSRCLSGDKTGTGIVGYEITKMFVSS
jgi:hypothetical protein